MLFWAYCETVVPPSVRYFPTDVLLRAVLSVVPIQVIGVDISLRRSKAHPTGVTLDSSVQFGDDTFMSPVK